jgi:hypothetical protein
MAAGSMAIHSSMNALSLNTGYESKHAFALNLQFPETSKYPAARKVALVQELRTRVATLPGVAALTSAPLPGGSLSTSATPNGMNRSAGQAQFLVLYGYVEANYFETLSIPLMLGGSFHSQEGRPEYSVILSEAAARRLWPGQNPIGRSLRLGPIDERFHSRAELLPAGPSYQVIGVASNTRGAQFDGSDDPRIYLPLPTGRLADYPLLVRTRSDPAPVERAVESVMAAVDPNWTVSTSTLEELLRESAPFIVSSLAAAVACSIGLLGLLLAVIGIYGTVSYIVVLRTREVGIRLAIGAQKRDILRLILRQSAGPVVAGLTAGMLLAIGLSYLARGLLYGIHGVDAVSVVGVSLLFLAIALLASYPPARRAMRVDPIVSLRYE